MYGTMNLKSLCTVYHGTQEILSMIFGIYERYPAWCMYIFCIPRIFRSRTQVVLPHELLACIHHLLSQWFSFGKISLFGQFLWQYTSALSLPCKMTPARVMQPLKTLLDYPPSLWPFFNPIFRTSCWLNDCLCLVKMSEQDVRPHEPQLDCFP